MQASSPTPGEAAELESRLRALPKLELHVHLEGSIPPELMLLLARRNRLRLPFDHPQQFHRSLKYRRFKDFSDRLALAVHGLRQPQDFHDAVVVMGEGMVRQNIRYAEVTWTPQFYLHGRGALKIETIVAAMNVARAGLEARHGLVLRWIPDLVRRFPRAAQAVTEWACSAEARAAGVVALGLGGPEAGHPAADFAALFRKARAAGLPANPHAGEGAGPQSVWQTLEALSPSRIGHGVRSIEDPALVEHLAQMGLHLEVCPTSNVALGVYRSFAAHPLKRLLAAGCKVSINSDDPVLFRTTLTQEYLRAVRHCGLDLADIRQSILAALQASYLTEPERSALRIRLLEDANAGGASLA